MKNFLNLLATEPHLTIVINGKEQQANLRDPLSFDADDSVTIDDIEVLPKYSYLANNGVLTIPEPFYHWLHRVTGQGWLLMPQ